MAAAVLNSLCGSCVKVIQERQPAVMCYGKCKKWWHIACAKISKQQYDHFKCIANNMPGLKWYCTACVSNVDCNKETDSGAMSSASVSNDYDSSAILNIVVAELGEISKNYLTMSERLLDLGNENKTFKCQLSEILEKNNITSQVSSSRSVDRRNSYSKNSVKSGIETNSTAKLTSNPSAEGDICEIDLEPQKPCSVNIQALEQDRTISDEDVNEKWPTANSSVKKKSSSNIEDNTEVQALDRLLEVASCPVCKERISSSVRCCDNGHATCDTCGKALTLCPVCRGPFSQNRTIFLSDLIAALPNRCKHPDCGEIKFNIHEHEKYCVFRQTRCRSCNWRGMAMDLYAHVKDNHPLSTWEVGTGNVYKYKTSPSFNLQEQNSFVYNKIPFIINEQLFWMYTKIDRKNKIVIIQLVSVPMRKVEEVFYMTLECSNEYVVNTCTIKFPFEPNKTLNELSFHLDTLGQFADEDNMVEFKIMLKQEE